MTALARRPMAAEDAIAARAFSVERSAECENELLTVGALVGATLVVCEGYLPATSRQGTLRPIRRVAAAE